MPRASLDKGRRFRMAISRWWSDQGWETFVRGLGEAGDDMRLEQLPMLSFELKDVATRSLGTWMHQAIGNAKGRVPIVIFKRYGVAATEKQWVLIEMGQFERMLRMATFADMRPFWVDHGHGGAELGDGLAGDDGGSDDGPAIGPDGSWRHAARLHLVDSGLGPHVATDDDADDDDEEPGPAEAVTGLAHLSGDDVA